MIVAFDNTFLTLIINPKAKPGPDPATGLPVSHYKQRLDALIDSLSGSSNRVIIPAPCLAETLVAAADIANVLELIKSYSAIEIAPFDGKSAVELAIISQKAIANGDKRNGSVVPWQQIKFDRQIVAIAKTANASIFYTDDASQSVFATEIGLSVKHSWELDLPPEYAQRDISEILQNETGSESEASN